MYKCIRHTVMYRKNTRKEVTIMKKSKIARWITAGFTAFTFLFALIIPMGGGYTVWAFGSRRKRSFVG